MDKKDITTQIYDLLEETASYIDNTTWHNKYSLALKSLQEELKAPCVLAVAGKVKAGKSFLVNALLGVDIAMTGTTETTATVNIFKKGTPPSKERPILCVYLDGHKEWVSKQYLDSLQGTNKEALEKTTQIDKLIMYINDNPLLDYVTLVDTPGIGAEVGEDGDSHQIQTDAYFNLRERHQQDTINLSNTADAIIYLFNTVPTETDKNFLASLYNGGHGITSLNGIGVLSKVDKDLTQIDNISHFCKEFEQNLFTIVPTSAAIEKYIPSEEQAYHLRDKLKKGFSVEKGFLLAIGSETAFLHEKLPYCNISVSDRKAILESFAAHDLAWSSFALIAKELYYSDDISTTLNKLKGVGGIQNLRNLIFDHFFKRSHMLRGNKVVEDLRGIINSIIYDESFALSEDYAKMKDDCISSCQCLPTKTRNVVINLIKSNIPSLEQVQNDKNRIFCLKGKIEKMQAELQLANDQYIMYMKIVDAKEQFSQTEFAELCSLFSGQFTDGNPRNRYKYWSSIYNMSLPNSVRQYAAMLAKRMYSELLKI